MGTYMCKVICCSFRGVVFIVYWTILPPVSPDKYQISVIFGFEKDQ